MACLPWLDPDRLEYFLSSSGDILNVSIQKKYTKAIICSHEKRADFNMADNELYQKWPMILSIINPYWQILENSSRNFPKISVIRHATQTDFWKTHPVFFSKFQFQEHEVDRFLENSSIIFVKYRGMS